MDDSAAIRTNPLYRLRLLASVDDKVDHSVPSSLRVAVSTDYISSGLFMVVSAMLRSFSEISDLCLAAFCRFAVRRKLGNLFSFDLVCVWLTPIL